MAGNHNDRRKAKNGRGSPAEWEGVKKYGRGESQKAKGGNAALAGSLIAIGGAEDREDTKIILSTGTPVLEAARAIENNNIDSIFTRS